MSVFIASINSGSNGNCYYVGNNTEAVLIDLGISCRELEKRMKRLELKLEKVRAIFVSHEHSDHISGLEVTSRKYNLPVYITPRTLQNTRLKLDPSRVFDFSPHKALSFGDLEVTAFPKFHDAADPYSFLVEHAGVRIGVFTDIGHGCEQVITHFNRCHAAFLEANYDEEMLENSSYPIYLKNRIRSKQGHLSNDQALELFVNHRSPRLSHLFLSHLSKNNNDPERVHELFLNHAGSTNIAVASRYQESEVYRIQDLLSPSPVVKSRDIQLDLF